MSWNKHMDQIIKKANITLGFLRRNPRVNNAEAESAAYSSVVRSILEYSSTVWSPYTKYYTHKIEMSNAVLPDFQKAAAFIHEFMLKLQDDSECAELRDSLNLALLHMQKYYRVLQHRNHEKNIATSLSLTARGLSPMTPFVDAPDKFQYKWINLDSFRLKASMGMDDSLNIIQLPPIIQAAKSGSVDEIAQLINDEPACSDDQDGLGRTALTYAVHYQQMSALHCLLENEANPNVTAHDGSTAIHQACHDSNSMALNLLLQYGGDFTIPDTHGRAPIHWAVTTPYTDCLQLLIHHHADVNIRDKDGLSPSMWACRLDHIEHFQLLSQAENFHVEDHDGIERDLIGRTWMHWAVRRLEPLECLQTLLTETTASIRDEEGRTVLLTAAELGSLAACRIILEIGGKRCLRDQDNQSRNALHLATIGGHGDVVNFLLENGVDLSAVDKFNATPWDYAKNRQLHYCQLIIMSHQRQRLVSNPASPIPSGLGLMLNGFGGSFTNGDFGSSIDFDGMSTRGSIDSQPITPPHPPKRPRTSRMPVRRSRSLNSNDRDRIVVGSYSDRGPGLSREQSVESQGVDRRQITSAGGEMVPRGKERIEVSLNTHQRDDYDRGREEVAMATDDHLDNEADDEIDNVSVGGMDVSDIDEDEDHIPKTSRGQPRRGPPSQPTSGPPTARSGAMSGPGPKPSFQPRYQPRPPAQTQYTQAMQAPYRRSAEFSEESQNFDLQSKPPLRSPNPPPGATRGPGYYNRSPSPNPTESYPPPNRPRPAPRPPRMQPSPPKPQPRRTPSPVNRPGSGPSVRDQLTSPPSGQDQSNKDGGRPDSAGKPPGMLEGKKILPPPMLMPLENAPKPPPLNKQERNKKKKKKRRERGGPDRDIDRETDVRSPPEPPENLTPPRGFAAPLHPPPSATRQRGQSGIPSPKYSKGAPQKHESTRYVEESMEDEKEDSLGTDDRPPMVNGMAVPIREAPMKSARPGKRQQPMESEEYEVNGITNSVDGLMNDNTINEDEEVGPLIPPPQGFRGPSARPSHGRPLSQSVPQDSRSSSARLNSGKPPLPRGRGSASSSSRYRPSPPRRPSRPPTGRTDSQQT